jgi:hypothetical protein
MKKYSLLILLILCLHINSYADIQPRFFITATMTGDKDQNRVTVYCAQYESLVRSALLKAYPCAKFNDMSSIRAMLNFERERELLGSSDENLISNLSQTLGCDYLVSLKIIVNGSKALLSAACMDRRKAVTISRVDLSTNHPEEVLSFSQISQKLVDALKTYEICPFKGPVKVNIVSSYKYNQPVQYSVYCNGFDGTYKKTTTIEKYSDSDWSIQKLRKNASSGTFKYDLHEESTVEEQNSCYECSATKQGPRTYFEKTTTYAQVQGLSNESESEGIKVDDARIELTFTEDGTYTMRVKATSKQGEKKKKKEVRAEGVCNNINTKPETITSKVDEGINEIFGPFNGKAFDKELSQKNTIKRTNPINGEEETITYEFNLKND